MQIGELRAQHLVNGCSNNKAFFSKEFRIDQKDQVAQERQYITFLRTNKDIQLFEIASGISYPRSIMKVEYKNHVIANGVSGVLALATVITKEGAGKATAVAAVGSSTCAMTRLTRLENVKGPDGRWWKQEVPRDFYPTELILAQDHLQQQASQALYQAGKGNLGMASSLRALGALESTYFDQSHKLRSWFREMGYQFSDMLGVQLEELPQALVWISQNQLNNGQVLGRIKEIASNNRSTAFFHAPNNDLLYVMWIQKDGAYCDVQISTFRMDSSMPGGAFGWSTGSWNLENHGRGTSPSAHELIHTFPALK